MMSNELEQILFIVTANSTDTSTVPKELDKAKAYIGPTYLLHICLHAVLNLGHCVTMLNIILFVQSITTVIGVYGFKKTRIESSNNLGRSTCYWSNQFYKLR